MLHCTDMSNQSLLLSSRSLLLLLLLYSSRYFRLSLSRSSVPRRLSGDLLLDRLRLLLLSSLSLSLRPSDRSRRSSESYFLLLRDGGELDRCLELGRGGGGMRALSSLGVDCWHSSAWSTCRSGMTDSTRSFPLHQRDKFHFFPSTLLGSRSRGRFGARFFIRNERLSANT